MMKCCPKCNGRGTVGYFHIDHFVDIECDRCNGSGEVSETDMTNEEWFASLPTEEKADVLNEFVMEAYYDGLDGKIPKMHCCKDFQHWLKEEHKE